MTNAHTFITPTAKGQIVIPVALRRKLGITAKTKIRVYEEDGRVILQPITREQIRRVRGMFKGSGMLASLIEDRAWEREQEERRLKTWNQTASSTPRP